MDTAKHSLDHETSSLILEDFVRAMDECGSWPDEEADLMRLAEIAHRARCHANGIPHERRCPRPLPTNSERQTRRLTPPISRLAQ